MTAPTVAPLAAALPQLMEQHRVPGVSVATIEARTLADCQGFGLARREPPQPVTPATVFEGASLSKPVFAHAVLELCAGGRLDLDVPLVRYHPTVFGAGDERLCQVTARHVLSHTAGFRNWTEEAAHSYFTPGRRFSYSSKGYEYLRLVVERLTGEPLAGYLQRQALDRFGMRDSSFVWQEAYERQAATGHNCRMLPQKKDKPTSGSAGGSLHCTAADFARFMAALLWPPGDSAAYLPAEWRGEMLRPQVAVNDNGASWLAGWPRSHVVDAEGLHWGLGWGLETRPAARAVWHWGDNDGFRSFAIAYPDTGRGIVLMTNSDSGLALADAAIALHFGADGPALRWLGSFYGF